MLCAALLVSADAAAAPAAPAATPKVFAHPVKSKAQRTRLQKIAAQLRAVRVIRARFRQTKHIRALSRPLVSEGKLLFARGGGVLWHTLRPFPSVIVLTPNRLVEKDPATGKVRSPNGPRSVMKALSQIFIAIIGVDIQRLSTMFALHLTGTPQLWTLGLRPTSSRLRRFLRYVVLQGGATIQRVTIAEANGDTTHYVMSKVKTQPPTLTPAEKKRFQ